MAFFKFRKGGDAPAPPPPESIEAMRRRARYRLTGAAVLVLAGVLGFPLLFDTQPRPIAVDIPIEIPDRNKVRPLGTQASSAAPTAQPAIPDPVIAAAPPAAASAPSAAASTAARTDPAAPGKAQDATPASPEERQDAKPEARGDTKAAGRTDGKGEVKADSKPAETRAEPKAEVKADAKAARSPDPGEASKAKALLEGKTEAAAAAASAPAGEARYVVQVGAFADAAKAQDTRQKVERSGLKTYTHVAETKEGKRTRVRVGPFATKSEADKAAARIKGLDLPAAVLTL